MARERVQTHNRDRQADRRTKKERERERGKEGEREGERERERPRPYFALSKVAPSHMRARTHTALPRAPLSQLSQEREEGERENE